MFFLNILLCPFFSLLSFSQMYTFDPKILLLLFFISYIKTDTETVIKSSGDLYFTNNEHVLKFELNLENYFLSLEEIKSNAQILEEKCNKKSNENHCHDFDESFKRTIDLES